MHGAICIDSVKTGLKIPTLVCVAHKQELKVPVVKKFILISRFVFFFVRFITRMYSCTITKSVQYTYIENASTLVWSVIIGVGL